MATMATTTVITSLICELRGFRQRVPYQPGTSPRWRAARVLLLSRFQLAAAELGNAWSPKKSPAIEAELVNMRTDLLGPAAPSC